MNYQDVLRQSFAVVQTADLGSYCVRKAMFPKDVYTLWENETITTLAMIAFLIDTDSRRDGIIVATINECSEVFAKTNQLPTKSQITQTFVRNAAKRQPYFAP